MTIIFLYQIMMLQIICLIIVWWILGSAVSCLCGLTVDYLTVWQLHPDETETLLNSLLLYELCSMFNANILIFYILSSLQVLFQIKRNT